MKIPRPAALAAALALAAWAGPAAAAESLERIKTIVVLYAENHSFDNIYGMFPGADGVANATAEQKTQVDHDGKPLPHLPPVYREGKIDTRFPLSMPNGPFRIDLPPVNAKLDDLLPNPTHGYYQHKEQIDGGRNDRFVAMNGAAGSWTMGYIDGSKLKMWQWAKRYTLADRFFMAAMGGSYANHQWLICACMPQWPEAPQRQRARVDEHDNLVRRPTSKASVLDGPVRTFDGMYTPDGYAIGSASPPYQPSDIPPGKELELADPAKFPLPPQKAKTIGDTLSAKGITWAWYAAGWDAAVADGTRPSTEKRTVIDNEAPGGLYFRTHHHPFNFYEKYAPGTAARREHLRDGREFEAAIAKGTLPQVSFYKPSGRLNQHPYLSTFVDGDEHLAGMLEKLEKSPQWPNMLVIVTYDDHGGYWDHVPPPRGEGWSDRWGPGSRVPAILVGPMVKKGYVDHTTYDTTSIIKLLARRFGLEPLPGVRKNMGDLTGALE